jgi:hypothetical protein
MAEGRSLDGEPIRADRANGDDRRNREEISLRHEHCESSPEPDRRCQTCPCQNGAM